MKLATALLLTAMASPAVAQQCPGEESPLRLCGHTSGLFEGGQTGPIGSAQGWFLPPKKSCPDGWVAVLRDVGNGQDWAWMWACARDLRDPQ